MTKFTRRQMMGAAGAAAFAAPTLQSLLWSREARAAIGDTLSIAYSTAPAGWDPNTGPQATSPGNQSIFRSIYDPYMVQRADLKVIPGVIDEFGWDEDRNGIHFRLRDGVKWHDGKSVTPDDIVWNLERLYDPNIGAPLVPIFNAITNIRVDGRKIHFDTKEYHANRLERLVNLGT